MESYKKIEERFAKLTALKQIDALLDWDRAVYMPEAGVDQRARQLGVLAVIMHEMQTAPEVGDWIAKTNRKNLSNWQLANLSVVERLYKHATALPASLVARKLEQETKTETVWRKAREENNFKLVQGELEKLLDIVREQAEVKSKKLGKSLYDSMMEPYSPGMDTAEVDAIFDDLAEFIPPFLNQVLEKQKEPLPLKGPFPQKQQEELCQKLCDLLKFDRSWGRLDTSTHPFSTGIGDDVRITTRYKDEDFLDSLQGVAHEAGHGFFDRNVPAEWRAQMVGASDNMGMAIHESQSLSYDMQLCRGLPFWRFVAPHVHAVFGDKPEHSAENLFRLTTCVSRSLIRVEADEVTYPAHVIFRYRLERAMVEGKLEVKDLPEAWNAGIQKLIGTTPPSDKLGCLQDIHWYAGYFGYFPSYALGAIIAAQLASKMRKDIPDLDARVERGDIVSFNDWLKNNIHVHACLYTPQGLIEKVTGEKMTARYFKAHLKERYLENAACSATSAPGAKRRA